MTEGSLRHNSDAVVWGTYVESETGGEGTIKVKRTEKGPKLRSIPIYWNSAGDGDGAGCPSLPKMANLDRGSFFLRRAADGSYSVFSYDHLRPRIED